MRAFRGLLILAVAFGALATNALAQRAGPAFVAGPRISGPSSAMGPREPRGPIGPRGPGWNDGGGLGVVVTTTTTDDGSGKHTNRRQTRRTGGSGVPPIGETRFIPNEVVLEFRNISPEAITALGRRLRLTQLERQSIQLTNSTIVRWRIPDGRSVSAVVRAAEAQSQVSFAQPNYLYSLQEDAAATPKPAASLQYAVAKLHLPQALEIAKGDHVLVAVIDSEIDASHPELAGAIAESYDADGSPGGPHMHGTAIAGLIVAHSRLQGVAPAAHILAVRAFGSAEGNTFNILKGADWAAGHGARIINMSFAGPADPALQRSLEAATKRGIVLIAAAGNAGPKSPPLYPAAHANVVAVTATDPEDRLFAGANRGRHIAVAAPGVDLVLANVGGGYMVNSGTSFSAAEVSGIVALMLERKSNLTPAAVRSILQSTAKDLGPKGIDDQFGAGLVDAYQAVAATQPQPLATDTTAVPVLSSSGR
ncbi:MAG TPA: S8 family serine peptidase [Pseudolabrys sp.]|nr:S8 family serine peptidase [Pseudolabrys sp.]